jgi:hypothetical protein
MIDWNPESYERDVADVADVADLRLHADTSGDELLDDLHAFLSQFVAFPSREAADAVTAWVLHSHVLDAFDTTPRLALLSPEPGSGKTRALEVIELLVPNPMPTFNASAAVLFRSMTLEDDNGVPCRPTVLLDEADTIFGPRASREHEDLRGFINAGYRRGANAQRAAIRGKSVVIETFPAFAAVVIAGLDDLPDTVMTRSIVIRMRRRGPGETVKPYRRRHYADAGAALAARCSAYGGWKYEALSESVEDLPDGIEDRAADIWEPLIAVGDTAGPKWRERIRAAAVALVGEARSTGETLGIRLLGDLREVFGDSAHLPTTVLLDRLVALDESPWGDLRGKPLDARGLSRRLAKYGVKPSNIRDGDTILKGYKSEDLHDPWCRYLPPPPGKSATSATSATSDPPSPTTEPTTEREPNALEDLLSQITTAESEPDHGCAGEVCQVCAMRRPA